MHGVFDSIAIITRLNRYQSHEEVLQLWFKWYIADHELMLYLWFRWYLPGHAWVLQSAILVLLLSPEHGLAPGPEGGGLVQLRVSVMVWLPVPHVLEHSVRPDSAHSDHPPSTDTETVTAVSQIRHYTTRLCIGCVAASQ